jgi:pimeloyl-ACP methyl ester carboxylesterase
MQVDGLNLFHREAGDPKSPAVLLLHGFPTSSHMYRKLIRELSPHQHVIAPDLPGFGFSDAPDHKTFAYTFANFSDVVDEFVEQLDLFYDYRTNVPLYPEFQAYFRKHQPPTLIAWGKNDFIFPPEGAAPYERDLKHVETHLFDTGHFALETHAPEIGEAMRLFLAKVA